MTAGCWCKCREGGGREGGNEGADACGPPSVVLNVPSLVSPVLHSAFFCTSSYLKLRHASSVHRDGEVHVEEWQLDWHSRRSAAMFAAGVSAPMRAAKAAASVPSPHEKPTHSVQDQPFPEHA